MISEGAAAETNTINYNSQGIDDVSEPVSDMDSQPGELSETEVMIRLPIVIHALIKKDFRRFFVVPWSESFAPGFRKRFPNQLTLTKIQQLVSSGAICSQNVLYKVCLDIFENAISYIGHSKSDSYMHKYAVKMKEFLIREMQRAFPGFEADASDITVDIASLCARENVSSAPEPKNQSHITGVTTASDGSSRLSFLLPEDCEKVETGNGYISVQPALDSHKLRVKPFRYCRFGPFSSYAPCYDSSSCEFTKEDSDLLYQEFYDKKEKQYAREMLDFAKKNNFITTYFAEEFHESVMNDSTLPDMIHIPSDVAYSNEAPTKEEVSQLKELSKLGIDVSFLDEVEAATECEEDENRTTNELLEQLMKLQSQRLSKPHVNNKFFKREYQVADTILKKLTDEMVKS